MVVQPNQFLGTNVFKDGLMNALNSATIVASKNMLTNSSYKLPNGIKSPCENCWYYISVIKSHPERLSKYASGNPHYKQDETSYLHKHPTEF